MRPVLPADVQLAALLQLLSCPVPSVAALLLHSVKQHFAAHWPPDGAALAAVLQLLPAVESQPDTDISTAELHSFLEASETAGAAANLTVFLLLKASPEDEMPQASHCMSMCSNCSNLKCAHRISSTEVSRLSLSMPTA